MARVQGSRFFTLLQREFREYRNSLFWAPVITAGVLGLLMLGSVVLANRISVFSDVLLQSVMKERSGVSISISMVDDGDLGIPVAVIDRRERSADTAGGAEDLAAPSYEVVVEENTPAEQWNFSREWRFNPQPDADEARGEDPGRDLGGRELNPLLNVVHGILLLVLLITSFNYLLSSLYDDRKDRSILFWRSMPVSEWQVVLSKFVMALVVAPLLYIAISLLLQICYVLLMMVLVWRMGEDPFDTVVANIDFVALMGDPVGGWILTALWIAPLYAWLLLASSAARRSPIMEAVMPVLALMIAEAVFLGSEHVADAVQNHFPHMTDSSAVGFYLFGPDWRGINLLSMASGFVFAGLALAATVWLRRNRWEL